MNELLKNLLSELKVSSEYHQCFDNSIIEQATLVESKQLFIIELLLETPLAYETYHHLMSQAANHHYDFKIIVKYINSSYAQDLVLSYYKNILNEHFSKESSAFINNIEFSYLDQDLKLVFPSEGIMLLFERYKSKMQSLMEQAGFNLFYQFSIDETHQINDDIEKMITSKDVKIFDYEKSNSDVKKAVKSEVQRDKKVMYRKSLSDLSQYEVYQINDLYDEYKEVCIEGYVFASEIITTRNGKNIQTIKVTDFSDSIILKRFEGRGLTLDDMNLVKKGLWIKAVGDIKYDEYAREHVLFLQALEIIPSKEVKKFDTALEKRVELHLHTNMSSMDGINPIGDYLKQASQFGHTALALTDHNNVQAFPDAQHAGYAQGLKIIYGLESNVIDDSILVVYNPKNINLQDACYVHFDFETTGLSSEKDEIIEIGAVKYQDGMEVDRFQSFVKPVNKVSLFIKQLTGIDDFHLTNAPSIAEILPDFISFYEDCILVAHNAAFDIGFLNKALSNLNKPSLQEAVIDTLQLSRILDKNRRMHNLGATARSYGVNYDTEVAHRADYDAMVLSQVYEAMMYDLKENHNVINLNDINILCDESFLIRQRPFHSSLLVKNKAGLKDLFKLVSMACTTYFYGEPRLLKSKINEFRNDLLIGSGCINGEVYDKVKAVSKEKLLEIMSFYDYIEIFPNDIFSHLIDLNVYESFEEVQAINKYLIDCAKELGIPVVACGDVHYLNESDKVYRDVYISALGIGGKIHPLFDRKNRITNIPNQHFKTTNEMLEDFAYLGEELAFEVVVKNTNMIADMIEEVKPIKDQLYTPKIEGVDDKLNEICYKNAHRIYGNVLPEIVEARLKKELDSIIKHGFAVVYYISSLLVEKSLSDGYLVGSRGSVGSSFVATMSNITEVNPLAPHYICPQCQFSEFFDDGSIASGYDLPPKVCPQCGGALKGDGQDIPFETFLGFEGDKVPDIDLNFSSEYQAKAHAFTKEIFGEDFVFRAGTISTVQAKTAFGYARGYHEKKGSTHNIRNTEYERLALGCEGVKRTTGQHPGGIIVIPDYMDVYDFTPVNFPADDVNSVWKTTHFDFHAIHDNVLKLDILGHVDPTAIRMLQDLTGIDPKDIPPNDPLVMSLFSSNKALGIENLVDYKNAAIGIPEFGTFFVRSMLDETNPSSFAELVQISGLSHGTDVWLTNAQDLIKRGICTLKDVIGCRDDIMVYLMHKGLEPKLAFTIMESVRKGKGLNDEWILNMKQNNVPDWYIESCQKIKYMFPKAHAAAYVLMALRVAYFKVHHPLEYYVTYFTTRCDSFELEVMVGGVDVIKARINEINSKGFDASNKEKNLIPVFEICIELYYRGFSILPVDVEKSQAKVFSIDHEAKAILPPFTCIDGLGDSVAFKVVEARQIQPFISKEDLEKRTSLNHNHILYLDRIGSLSHLQELNQLSLF